MDLAKIEATYAPNEGAVIELTDLNGEQLFNDDGSPMTITVIGADSDVAAKHRASTTTKRIQQAGRVQPTGEVLEAEEVAYLAKLTVDWDITLGGEKPPFSQAAVIQFYKNPRFAFIRDQVDKAVVQRQRFLKI